MTKWMFAALVPLMLATPAEAATHVRVTIPAPTIVFGGQPTPPPPVVVEERVIYVERPAEEVRYVEVRRPGPRVVYVRGGGPDRGPDRGPGRGPDHGHDHGRHHR